MQASRRGVNIRKCAVLALIGAENTTLCVLMLLQAVVMETRGGDGTTPAIKKKKMLMCSKILLLLLLPLHGPCVLEYCNNTFLENWGGVEKKKEKNTTTAKQVSHGNRERVGQCSHWWCTVRAAPSSYITINGVMSAELCRPRHVCVGGERWGGEVGGDEGPVVGTS